jgi:hypothetical protein
MVGGGEPKKRRRNQQLTADWRANMKSNEAVA